ncbi:hypothetical protein JMJ35_010528 [Cladonia borealis]|uniref:Heterokaryon incompatibility domain-containing protein n=1 Tax=Cladonia borealis TaxID=184061 RepID=A0AA39QQ47_9LECA|nr:hypothetical protein JMJ35_010528 [Cladonia borealis]
MRSSRAYFSQDPPKKHSHETRCYKLRQTQLRHHSQQCPERYSYNQLPKDGSKIRLIELLGGGDPQIRCKMHVVDLEDTRSLLGSGTREKYEALSYTWQSQTLSDHVICNGKVLYVTQILYAALRTLRRATGSRLLWIDQLCINQEDVIERNSQVRLMRLIYNRADLVIAWLGLEDDYTAAAVQLIQTIFEKHVSPDLSLDAEPEAIWDKQQMDAMGLPHFPSFPWEALARLFERPYFRRTWVVQEVVVASDIIIRCGSFTISWEYVEYIARSLLATGWIRALKKVYGSNCIPNYVQTIGNIKAGFSELKGGPGIPLSLLLNASRRFGATDPRDKVIALVGLADHRSLGSSATAVLDYSKSVEDLYTEVTGHLIKRERSLNLLSSVEDIVDRFCMSLPSWVPNYSIWQRHTILGSSIRVPHLNFHTAGNSQVVARWQTGSRVLELDGICYDTIETVSNSSLDRQTEDENVVLEWLDLAEPLIRRGFRIEGFWRALIGERKKGDFPGPEQYGTPFDSYLAHAKSHQQGHTQILDTRRRQDSSGITNPLVKQATLGYVAPNRKFFTTTKDLIGLGPRSMCKGDIICIMSGGRVPYVLREERDHHRLIGEAYVHGLMEGQAVDANTVFHRIRIH